MCVADELICTKHRARRSEESPPEPADVLMLLALSVVKSQHYPVVESNSFRPTTPPHQMIDAWILAV